MLPWILFALTLVAAVGGILVEEQKLDATSARVASAAKSEEKARAELTDVGNAKRALETRVSELQTENGRLTAKVAAAARVDADDDEDDTCARSEEVAQASQARLSLGSLPDSFSHSSQQRAAQIRRQRRLPVGSIVGETTTFSSCTIACCMRSASSIGSSRVCALRSSLARARSCARVGVTSVAIGATNRSSASASTGFLMKPTTPSGGGGSSYADMMTMGMPAKPRTLAHALGEMPAVHDRQHEIEEDQARPLGRYARAARARCARPSPSRRGSPRPPAAFAR